MNNILYELEKQISQTGKLAEKVTTISESRKETIEQLRQSNHALVKQKHSMIKAIEGYRDNLLDLQSKISLLEYQIKSSQNG